MLVHWFRSPVRDEGHRPWAMLLIFRDPNRGSGQEKQRPVGIPAESVTLAATVRRGPLKGQFMRYG